MSTFKPDDIYANPHSEIVDFAFDARVVAAFPDMIQRSVPGYSSLVNMIGILAARHLQADTRCYDLGCSLGAVSLSIQQRAYVACELVAVDNAAAMIIQCGERLLADDNISVSLRQADIQDITIENASVVVLNFTLQFIPLADRLALLQKIYAGLNDGGIIILSEKLAFEADEKQDFFTDFHHDFKRANGYSDLEISQKRSALENVLIPETLAAHQQRLAEAGFSSSDVWFQCANFVSLVAVKKAVKKGQQYE